ncbi:MAG: hypothetical protein Q8P42_14250, partial [Gallionella sp.]|nr:hypothetical protein [Gallionella sp.]
LRPKRVKQAGNDENRVENSGICLFFVQSLAGATVCCSGNFKSDRLLEYSVFAYHPLRLFGSLPVKCLQGLYVSKLETIV